jgi:hypothetical protein
MGGVQRLWARAMVREDAIVYPLRIVSIPLGLAVLATTGSIWYALAVWFVIEPIILALELHKQHH